MLHNYIKKVITFVLIIIISTSCAVLQDYNIMNKNNIINIQNEFEILIINDFLEIEKIYQNNLYKRNVLLETGYTKIQKNKCIDRSLPIWKINMNDLILQT